jgi:hypothetical protein
MSAEASSQGFKNDRTYVTPSIPKPTQDCRLVCSKNQTFCNSMVTNLVRSILALVIGIIGITLVSVFAPLMLAGLVILLTVIATICIVISIPCLISDAVALHRDIKGY